MGDELAKECMEAMEAAPENRRGILMTYLNKAREEERNRCLIPCERVRLLERRQSRVAEILAGGLDSTLDG